MKHSIIITLLLLGMFFAAQLIGIAVIGAYSPETTEVTTQSGNLTNVTTYNLPYGMDPPEDLNPQYNLFSILIAFVIAIVLMIFLMKFKAETFLRLWFFVVVAFAIGVTLNAALLPIPYSSLIVLLLALPLAYAKVFKRDMLTHNFTELLIYPGIAAIFVPLLNVLTVVALLIIISLYDMYAVWHAGFMQKMAHYQINTLKVFSGFFIPYTGKKVSTVSSKSKAKSSKKIKVNVAILGGGDVVFPIIVAGVVLYQFSLAHALIVSVGATLALAGLFYMSEKGKFYPAMPFISLGCLVALGIVYLIG